MTMANSRKKQDYDNKYIREHYKGYLIRLSCENEQDIIEHLDQQENKNEYIKSLIQADMKKTQD